MRGAGVGAVDAVEVGLREVGRLAHHGRVRRVLRLDRVAAVAGACSGHRLNQ